MIETLFLDNRLQTFKNLSFHKLTSAITNTDYIDVGLLFVFILFLALYSDTFCSTEIKAFD